jgi:hypothetical protein
MPQPNDLNLIGLPLNRLLIPRAPPPVRASGACRRRDETGAAPGTRCYGERMLA